MITVPTTEQIILDCRRELREVIEPAVGDDGARIAIQMLENVLRNVATRAAHEIAWMREETDEMEAFARSVADAHPSAKGLAEALDALAAGRSESLHLADVVKVYSLAGDALSCAVEAATGAGDDTRTAQAAALLATRVGRELEITGSWGMVGRG